MPWFDAFSRDPREYERLQLDRVDYRRGIETLARESHNLALTKDSIDVLDIGGGTGIGSAGLCALDNVKEVAVIDHDPHLLSIAASKSPKIKPVEARMQDFQLGKQYDLLIAAYAYHHLPDDEKRAFCSNLASHMKDDSDLLLLEICGNRGKEIEDYYDSVIANTHGNSRLTDFLKWTASRDTSQNGEFKVPLQHLIDDFKSAGLEVVDTQKVWAASTNGVGNYLLRLRKTHSA